MSQDYVQKCWNNKTSEFRMKVEAEGEETHRAALEEWKSSWKVPEGAPKSITSKS
jgi:hypothetical protein